MLLLNKKTCKSIQCCMGLTCLEMFKARMLFHMFIYSINVNMLNVFVKHTYLKSRNRNSY